VATSERIAASWSATCAFGPAGEDEVEERDVVRAGPQACTLGDVAPERARVPDDGDAGDGPDVLAEPVQPDHRGEAVRDARREQQATRRLGEVEPGPPGARDRHDVVRIHVVEDALRRRRAERLREERMLGSIWR
jgi:hypothetical protein